jgi:hypothetical protein
MDQLTSIEYFWIADFIGQKWPSFLSFMEEKGVSEAECHEFYERLESFCDDDH